MLQQIITQSESYVKTQIKPFDRQGNFTVIDNIILDHIMPALSPNAWKVLCFILRKTRGWQKDEDKLSITQIMDGTGIKNRNTVSNAISQLENDGYILVHRPDDKKTPNTYSLNRDYELVQKSYQENGQASTEIVPDLVQKSYPQKKVFKQNNNIAGKPAGKLVDKKPKTRLMNKFVAKTGLPIPSNKPDKSFWWSKIAVIYQAVGEDADLGERLIDEAIDQLRRDEMPISGPVSLVKTIYSLVEKSNRTNGKHIDKDQYVEVEAKEPESVDLAVDEDWLAESLAKVREGLNNGS